MAGSRQLRWASLIFDFDPVRGHEQGGERRSLVVSYEPLHSSAMATVCPITAARKTSKYPNEIAIPRGEAGQTENGLILCHQVRTVSLERVSGSPPRIIGYLTDRKLRSQVREALAIHLALDLDGLADGADLRARWTTG